MSRHELMSVIALSCGISIISSMFWLTIQSRHPRLPPPEGPAPVPKGIHKVAIFELQLDCIPNLGKTVDKWSKARNLPGSTREAPFQISWFFVISESHFIEIFYEPIRSIKKAELRLGLVPSRRSGAEDVKDKWSELKLDQLWLDLNTLASDRSKSNCLPELTAKANRLWGEIDALRDEASYFKQFIDKNVLKETPGEGQGEEAECQAYALRNRGVATCNRNTDKGFYWRIGRKIGCSTAGDPIPLPQVPACNADYIGAVAVTWNGCGLRQGFAPPISREANNDHSENIDKRCSDNMINVGACDLLEAICLRQ